MIGNILDVHQWVNIQRKCGTVIQWNIIQLRTKIKFASECMELETVTLSEVTQTTNTETVTFLLQVVVSLSYQYVGFNPNAYSNCVEVF